MATVTLSLHAKQPKRGTIAYDKGYIELYEYPRGQKAVITYTEDGSQEIIRSKRTAKASSMRFWIWKQPLQERMIIPTSITAEMSWNL